MKYYSQVILGLLACLYIGSSKADAEECSRIISTAPSLSEMVTTLGLRDHLIGVSRFDPLANDKGVGIKKIQEIGGLLDLNSELIISLNPSLILGLDESQDRLRSVSQLGKRVELFDHRSLLGINHSIDRLGVMCGKTPLANSWRQGVSAVLGQLKQQINKMVPPSDRSGIVIISSGGGAGFYLSGTDGYYSYLLGELGLHSSYNNMTQAMGDISAEGLLALAPKFIIEIIEPGSQPSLSGYLSSSLGSLSQKVPALRDNKIVVISDDYASIPGPISYPLLAQKIAKNLLGK